MAKKPTDLDLHCLQRQGIARSSRTKVNIENGIIKKKPFGTDSRRSVVLKVEVCCISNGQFRLVGQNKLSTIMK